MTASTAAKPGFTLKGWHVAVILVTFFLLVFIVDGLMMFRAYSTFPGEVVAKPYEEGIGFNAEIRRRAAARAMGWTAALLDSRANGRVRLVLSVTDRDGKPVDGLSFTGSLSRAVTTRGAEALHLTRIAPGTYETTAVGGAGLWDFSVMSAAPGGKLFEVEQRLVWQ